MKEEISVEEFEQLLVESEGLTAKAFWLVRSCLLDVGDASDPRVALKAGLAMLRIGLLTLMGTKFSRAAIAEVIRLLLEYEVKKKSAIAAKQATQWSNWWSRYDNRYADKKDSKPGQ